jgi:hypothetical protein
MRTRKDEETAGVQYLAGVLALALTCLCLLCIIFFTAAAHASVGTGYHTAQMPHDPPTVTSTPSPTVTSTPSPTITSTPSPTVTTTPTVTSTPSPTVTNTPTATSTTYPYPTPPTTTPRPSPSATINVFPSPTTASTVGAKTSPTVVASPGASPTGGATPTSTNTNTQGTRTNPGSGSPTPANNSSDTSNQGANPLANILPFILIGLGVIVLLALLFIPARIILRKRLVPLPSPRVPPSGAAPWSRTPASPQPGQPFPFTQQQGNGFYPQPLPTTPFGPTTNGYIGLTQSQSYQSFSTPPVTPAWNAGNRQNSAPVAQSDRWLLGEAQNQQPFPTTPPLIPKVQAAYAGNQPGQTTSPAPPDNPFAGANQPFDESNTEARKRLRRSGLRSTDDQIAFPDKSPANFPPI